MIKKNVPRGSGMEAVDEIFAIRPLREVRHRRRSRVLDVVRRAYQVEHESEPHERAHRDARDDGGSALLSSIGVDGLSVAVNKTRRQYNCPYGNKK